MKKLLDQAAGYAKDFLEDIQTRAVGVNPDAAAAVAGFDEPMPDQPCADEEVLRLLDELGSPATMGMAGPRFFGFVIGGSLPATVAANWLATAWDQNTSMFHITPATAKLEEVAQGWLIDLLNLPQSTASAFVTGTTVANFTSLAAARHRVLKNAGWDVEADGLMGAPPITVLTGEEAHPTLYKSLGMLGLGRNRVVQIPVDAQGRIRVNALPRISGPAIICAQAGNIHSGAFDPFDAICDHAAESGAWVHVDGAFGLLAGAVPALAKHTAGMNRADSWATDAHKLLNVPYDCGIAFVNDADALHGAMAITAEYLPYNRSLRNPGEFTPELSRRARGVEVWAALKSLGRQGVIDMVERVCRHARRFAEGLSAAGYNVLNEVDFNQVVVSFGDSDTTERVIRAIQDDGTCWCGESAWQGHDVMRISVCSWATTEEDVEISLAAMLRCAAEITGTQS
jgi:glutamate/tyrosine decarboxylase-like PLP-dependent enzyme